MCLRPLTYLAVLAALGAGGCGPQHRDRDCWPICALPGATSPRDLAWLDPADARSVIVGGTRVFTAHSWVAALVPAPHAEGFLVLGDGDATLLQRAGSGFAPISLGRPPSRIRAAITDPSGAVVLILGGQTQPQPRAANRADEPLPWLMRGRVVVAWAEHTGLRCAPEDVPAQWNPFRLKAGRFAGEDNVLVAVYKRSPFDAVARWRPFIFRVTHPAGSPPRLQPRWRGSAFSHPFVDATFGDFTGSGEGEIAALEVAADGGRLLTAYHFEGFGLEGLAPTIALPEVDDYLLAADVCADSRAELVVLSRGDSPTFLAFGLTRGEPPELVQIARAPAPTEVIAWTAALGGVVCIGRDGKLHQVRWQATVRAAQ